jgi:GNAT superfamily N-acetyltransferase
VKLRIEPLGRRHNRKGFRCGEPALDRWFEQQASQDERRNISRVFVAVDDVGIVGFYSLSMFTIELEDLPVSLSRKLPNYRAIPAALIGRLARHERARGKGIGELLLADAVTRVLGVVEAIAAYAIVVDAKGPSAVAFYKSFGFILFPSSQSRLFLLCDTVKQALRP